MQLPQFGLKKNPINELWKIILLNSDLGFWPKSLSQVLIELDQLDSGSKTIFEDLGNKSVKKDFKCIKASFGPWLKILD